MQPCIGSHRPNGDASVELTLLKPELGNCRNFRSSEVIFLCRLFWLTTRKLHPERKYTSCRNFRSSEVKFSCRPFSAGTTQKPHGSSVEGHCATPGFLTTICSQPCRNFQKLALSATARVTSGEGLGRKSQVFAKSKLRPLRRRVSMVNYVLDRKAGKFNLETRVLRFQQLCDLALRISFNPCDVPVKHRLDLRARAFVMNLNHARQQCERAKFLDKVLALSGLSHRPTRRTPAQVTKTNLSLSVVSSC